MLDNEYTREEIRKITLHLSDLLDMSVDDGYTTLQAWPVFFETSHEYGILWGTRCIWSSENDSSTNPILVLSELIGQEFKILTKFAKLIEVIADGNSLESFLGRPEIPEE